MVELADISRTVPQAQRASGSLHRVRLGTAAVCMIGVALGAPVLPFCAVGAALGPMMLEFGWRADQVSIAYGLLMWAGALSVWPMGALADRFGPRAVVTAGVAGIAAVSLLLPMADRFWQFGALVVLLGALGSTGLGYTRIIASLFGASRGLAIGVLAAEGSALGVLMPLAMNRLMAEGGWRGAFTAIGLVSLALTPILYVALAGGRAAAWPPRWARPARTDGMSFSEAVRHRAFWIILAASLGAAAMGGAVLTSFGPAMAAKGFQEAAVHRAAPIMLMAALFGAVLSGAALDRSPTPRIAGAAFLADALAYLIWALASPRFGGEPMLVAGLAAGTFAFTAQVVQVTYLFSRYFGLKAFATLCGLQAFIQAVAPVVAGPALLQGLGAVGDYRLVFGAGIAVQILAALLYLLLPAYRRVSGAPSDAIPCDR